MKIKYAISSGGSWYYPRSKKHFFALARRELDKSGQIYCRVTYDREIFNHASTDNYKDVKLLVDSWTEPALLEYIKGGQFV